MRYVQTYEGFFDFLKTKPVLSPIERIERLINEISVSDIQQVLYNITDEFVLFDKPTGGPFQDQADSMEFYLTVGPEKDMEFKLKIGPHDRFFCHPLIAKSKKYLSQRVNFLPGQPLIEIPIYFYIIIKIESSEETSKNVKVLEHHLNELCEQIKDMCNFESSHFDIKFETKKSYGWDHLHGENDMTYGDNKATLTLEFKI